MNNKNKNILAFVAALGLSTAITSIAVADYDKDDHGYEPKIITAPQPLVMEEKQTVYEVKPQPVEEVKQIEIYAEQEKQIFAPITTQTETYTTETIENAQPIYTYVTQPVCGQCSQVNMQFPGPCNVCESAVQQVPLVNYAAAPDIYTAFQGNCCQMAPIALEHVDFRIQRQGKDGPYSNKLGNYRFRIFGCRRYNKEASLNDGRILERNINFAKVFEESVSSCYKVVPMPKDLCLQTKPTEMPEYVLTAEITDYFMNICDEYDWNKAAKKNQRTGTSEITITWRLMDLTKNKVYWKGESNGYGELFEGETNGETKLIERAFADATSNLRAITGFEEQLMQRKSQEQMAAERYALIEEERALNPMKCGYRKQYEDVKNCQISRPGAMLTQCGGISTVQEVVNSCISQSGQLIENSACHVVDDTWVDTGEIKSLDNLCIVTANPCNALTPETIYRMRSSVVQIDSPNGKKGAGLLISDRFILTSGDLVDANNNTYTVKTIRNISMPAHAVRVNPSKNTALLMLEQATEYTPLALNLKLPEVGSNGYLTLGLLDVNNFKDGENYLENSAKIEGYRYTDEKGAEILANTFIQNVTVGGGLFYKDCTVNGMAHSGIKTDEGLDVYVPTETALRSLGISICGQEYVAESPWQQTIYKPVSEQIQIVPQTPEVMKPQDRK